MLNNILYVLFLLQIKTKNCDSGVTDLLDYSPSSESLEGYNQKLTNISPVFTIRPVIAFIRMLENLRKGEKFKDNTVGKVNDAKEHVADTAKDAKKGVEDVGNKVKKIFK